jgi:hypothetical protein
VLSVRLHRYRKKTAIQVSVYFYLMLFMFFPATFSCDLKYIFAFLLVNFQSIKIISKGFIDSAQFGLEGIEPPLAPLWAMGFTIKL